MLCKQCNNKETWKFGKLRKCMITLKTKRGMISVNTVIIFSCQLCLCGHIQCTWEFLTLIHFIDFILYLAADVQESDPEY